MNELIDQMSFLLGCIVLIIVPLGILAAFIADKTSKNPKNEFDAKRQEDNLEVIGLLKKYIEDHPEQRLGQAMLNLNIIQDLRVQFSGNDETHYYLTRSVIYEEPCIILDRVEKTLARYK